VRGFLRALPREGEYGANHREATEGREVAECREFIARRLQLMMRVREGKQPNAKKSVAVALMRDMQGTAGTRSEFDAVPSARARDKAREDFF
jgi:hypothetical protein